MRSLCFSLCTTCSSRRYSPVQSPSSIPSTASNVDFPAPDGPMIVTKSPFATSSEIRRSTNCRPLPSGNDFSTLRTERKGLGARGWGLGPAAFGSGPPPAVPESPTAKPQAPTPSPQALFISQRDHRIDPRRPTRGQIARDKRHHAHQGCDGEVRDWIGGPHTVQRLRE